MPLHTKCGQSIQSINIDHHSVLNVYSAQPMSRVLIQSSLRDWQLLIIIRHLSVDICSLYAAGHDVRRWSPDSGGCLHEGDPVLVHSTGEAGRGSINPSHRVPLSYYCQAPTQLQTPNSRVGVRPYIWFSPPPPPPHHSTFLNHKIQ